MREGQKASHSIDVHYNVHMFAKKSATIPYNRYNHWQPPAQLACIKGYFNITYIIGR
nr:MAG TPA: hypothetical protein [Bacteriophage sp.]